jgi:hypothetical protein
MALQEMPTGSFICVCGESFPSEMALEDHAREAHSALDPDEVETYVCPECGSNFGTFAQLREHWEAHGDAPNLPGHASSA